MKKGVWVSGLVLTLGGWVSDLLAQEGAWRPAEPKPFPASLALNELKPSPAATIGRPIPLSEDPVFGPMLPALPTMPAPVTGVQQAAYHPPFFPPGSAAPTAKEISGGDKLPTWADVDDESTEPVRTSIEESGFAVDRLQPVIAPSKNTPALLNVTSLSSSPPPTIGPVIVTTDHTPLVIKTFPFSSPSALTFAQARADRLQPLPALQPPGTDTLLPAPTPLPFPAAGDRGAPPSAPFADNIGPAATGDMGAISSGPFADNSGKEIGRGLATDEHR